jgi:hypothetical protein
MADCSPDCATCSFEMGCQVGNALEIGDRLAEAAYSVLVRDADKLSTASRKELAQALAYRRAHATPLDVNFEVAQRAV